MVGFFFESVGDFQLARFKANKNNKGKVFDSGLWRATPVIRITSATFALGGILFFIGWQRRAWTILSPVLMAFLLLKVSGVTMLEKDISNRRPEYEAYKKRTNAFFPWFPACQKVP